MPLKRMRTCLSPTLVSPCPCLSPLPLSLPYPCLSPARSTNKQHELHLLIFAVS